MGSPKSVSHVVMQHRTTAGTVIVPVPDNGELKPGTLRSIIRQSRLSREAALLTIRGTLITQLKRRTAAGFTEMWRSFENAERRCSCGSVASRLLAMTSAPGPASASRIRSPVCADAVIEFRMGRVATPGIPWRSR